MIYLSTRYKCGGNRYEAPLPGNGMTDSDRFVRFAGDDDLAQFIEEKRPQLLSYIQHNLGPALRKKLEVEDIFQEVVLTALESRSSFDLPERDPFKLLCQIAEQRIIDAHRHHISAQKRSAEREVSIDSPVSGNQPQALIQLIVASMTSASQAFSRSEKELQLQEAIAELAEDQRQILQLRYIEGRPTKEIADLVGKSDGAVRVLLTRTLAKLQELLAASDHRPT